MLDRKIIDNLKSMFKLKESEVEYDVGVIILRNKRIRIAIRDKNSKDWYYEGRDVICVSHEDVFDKWSNCYVVSEYPKYNSDIAIMMDGIRSMIDGRVHEQLENGFTGGVTFAEIDLMNAAVMMSQESEMEDVNDK